MSSLKYKIQQLIDSHEETEHTINNKDWEDYIREALVDSNVGDVWLEELDNAHSIDAYFSRVQSVFNAETAEFNSMRSTAEQESGELQDEVKNLKNKLSEVVDLREFLELANLPSHFDMNLGLHQEKLVEALKSIRI